MTKYSVVQSSKQEVSDLSETARIPGPGRVPAR
jgi:hypothetical protein